jgi:hypothetical protein
VDNRDLLLVALVEMVAGAAEAGVAYEDKVLALLGRHGGVLEQRLRTTDGTQEVHVIRFADRAGYESYMIDPDRLHHRAEAGAQAPAARVLEVLRVTPADGR